MRAALDLASRGRGRVSPNPMVGALLIRGREVLAGGFHRRFGGPHAERDLLRRLAEARVPPDAILYLTLEPCTHKGKTPPCVDALLASSIRNFEIAMLDPDPRVRGRGVRALRSDGRNVRVGLVRRDAERLLLPFVRRHREGRAAVALKLAVSADGMLADAFGRSKWITGAEARRDVRMLRRQVDAVVVGRGTVEADDPRLRFTPGDLQAPSRIVLSRSLRFDPDCRLARNFRREAVVAATEGDVGERHGNWVIGDGASGNKRWRRRPRLIVATAEPNRRRRSAFLKAGWEIWDLPNARTGIDLPAFARRAASEGLIDLLVEAGPTLAAGFLDSGPVDRILLYMAPRLLGAGLSWAQGTTGIPLSRAPRLAMRASPLPGGDLRIEMEAGGRGAIVPPSPRRMR